MLRSLFFLAGQHELEATLYDPHFHVYMNLVLRFII